MIKVYKAEWYVNGKSITNIESGREFYSHEKAINDAECRKPESGIDYPQKDVSPEINVDCQLRHRPEDTHLMNLVLIESMDRMINFECKAIVKHVRSILIHNLITVEVVTAWMSILIILNCMLSLLIRELRLMI